MTKLDALRKRSSGKCELCSSDENLSVFDAPPFDGNADKALLLCHTCFEQIGNSATLKPAHWHCLNESMWSEVSAVKVMAWRMLKKLSNEGWARDLSEQLYLDDSELEWAQTGMDSNEDGPTHSSDSTKDSNGTPLLDGDSVTLIKDLDVKGANFTAKRGTLVKNISLTSNPEQIEGRVNGTQIVLLTKFLKKA